MVICSLDVLKKSSKKKETRIKKEMSRCCNKLVTVERDRGDEILGFDLLFVGWSDTNFNFIFWYCWLFSKSQFSGIQFSYIKL